MRLTELLNTENVTISCELFPPKQGAQLDNYKNCRRYGSIETGIYECYLWCNRRNF